LISWDFYSILGRYDFINKVMLGGILGNSEGKLEDKRYLETRKAYVESKNASLNSFDKYVLTLAAGALGLSLTFINEIVPIIEPVTFIYLIIAWSGFIASLISTLFSFLTSQWAFDKQISMLDDGYISGVEKNNINIPRIITNGLNIFSIISFVIGTFTLAIFIALNLSKGV
jgi:hypothetical protein